MDDLRAGLRDEAKRLVIDATYASRGHFAAAGDWARWDVLSGAPATVAGTLSAGGAAAAAVAQQVSLAAFLAVLAAALTALRGFLRPDERAEAHGAKANRFLALRNDARFFLEIDLRSARPVETLENQLRELRADYNRLITSPPHTVSRKNYEDAKRQIDAGEANYTNDALWKELPGGRS